MTGRRSRSDGATTRERILESARGLFAARGFAETPSKLVAADAGVDLASINYHFGSREGLYRAVLVDAHRRFIRLEDLQAIDASSSAPETKLGQLIDSVFGLLSDQSRWASRILAREMLAPPVRAELPRGVALP